MKSCPTQLRKTFASALPAHPAIQPASRGSKEVDPHNPALSNTSAEAQGTIKLLLACKGYLEEP